MSDDLWQRSCERLAAELPEQQFNTWIRPLAPAEVVHQGEVGAVVTLRVPNRFKLDWIRNQYAGRIESVLAELADKKKAGLNPEPFLLRKSGQSFYNSSPLDMKKLAGDQDHIRENLYSYIQAFSPAVRDVFERFDFHAQVLILPDLARQEQPRELGFAGNSGGRQEIDVRELVAALAIILGLHEPAGDQRAQTVVRLAEADAGVRREFPLRELGALREQAHHA